MTKILQKGNKNQISTGNYSPNIKGNKNKLNFTKENGKWFLTGFILPIITGLVVEILSKGKLSSLLSGLSHLYE